MTGIDVTATATATAFLLGCDERYGTIETPVRRWLETLLDESGQAVLARRLLADNGKPADDDGPAGVAINRNGQEVDVNDGPTYLP